MRFKLSDTFVSHFSHETGSVTCSMIIRNRSEAIQPKETESPAISYETQKISIIIISNERHFSFHSDWATSDRCEIISFLNDNNDKNEKLYLNSEFGIMPYVRCLCIEVSGVVINGTKNEQWIEIDKQMTTRWKIIIFFIDNGRMNMNGIDRERRRLQWLYENAIQKLRMKSKLWKWNENNK